MTEALRGKTREEAETMYRKFHGMVTGHSDDDDTELGKLTVLAGVRQYPSRVKCASLCWHTVNAALHGEDQATTE
jgi:nitrogen fixation NifU-like protein